MLKKFPNFNIKRRINYRVHNSPPQDPVLTQIKPSIQSHFISLRPILMTASVVKWSEFLVTDPEARVQFPALPKKKVVGLERGPLSLLSTTEELLDRKVAAPV
jgi:hypothetical protein